MDDTGQLFRMPIMSTPFRIGRESGLDLSLPAQVVSSLHAELYREDGKLMVRDLKSTNGTFLNQEPVENPATLKEGDILHFATFGFRVGVSHGKHTDTVMGTTAAIPSGTHRLMSDELLKFRRLLAERQVTELYQPIVSLQEGEILGYEVLGRGSYEGLPSGVSELFEMAAKAEAEVDLSLLMRQSSVSACGSLSGDYLYFLITHPAELIDDTLVRSLRRARGEWPDLRLAIEIHESAATDPGTIKRLQKELQELDMLLVYDDFGAGQARLLELADVPPHFLKFDRSLIRNIDQARPSSQKLLQGLVSMALGLGINIIAEGLESQTEVDVCRDFGFGYGQGFLFARPKPSEQHEDRLLPLQADSSDWL